MQTIPRTIAVIAVFNPKAFILFRPSSKQLSWSTPLRSQLETEEVALIWMDLFPEECKQDSDYT